MTAGDVCAPRAPGPAGWPLVGCLPGLLRGPLPFLQAAHRQHGDLVRLPLPGRSAYLVAHPEHVQQVLHTCARRYTHRSESTDSWEAVIGQGLLVSDGEYARRQRRMIQPAFRPDGLRGLGPSIVDAASRCGDELLAGPEVADVHAIMNRLALRIMGLALLSEDLTGDADAVGTAVESLMRISQARLFNPLALPLWVPTPSHREFQRAVGTLDQLVHRILAERRRSRSRPPDLLSTLLDARDPDTGEEMTDGELRDEVVTLLIAGFETTANHLTWSLDLFARHPAEAGALVHELDEVLEGRAPGAEDLPELPVTDRFLKESLRLRPAAWMIIRTALEDHQLGSFRIPSGSVVACCPYLTHRHSGFWSHPETFLPARFQGPLRHRFAYYPYGGGAHRCIGMGLADLVARLVMATLAPRLELTPLPDHQVVPEVLITLRPAGGLPLRVRTRRRQRAAQA